MKSTIRVEYDEHMKPFIDIRVDKHSQDMPDKALRQFNDAFGHESQYCKVYWNDLGDQKYQMTIYPVSTDLIKDDLSEK